MMNKIREWIVSLVCAEIVIGGNCGICGDWVSDVLLPRSWPFTVCKKCTNSDKCLCSVGNEPYHDDWCPAAKTGA